MESLSPFLQGSFIPYDIPGYPGAQRVVAMSSRCHGQASPPSVQLAFARQDAKEQGESDDDWRRSDDSYSPRRHWRFRSPTISVGPRLRTDV